MTAMTSLQRRDAFRGMADVLDQLVDDRVGVVQSLVEVRPEAGGPDFFHFGATAANTGAFTRLANFARTGGASAVREVAAAKAIGEAIERYSSAIFDVEELPLSSFRDAPFPCTRPDEFALYSPEQYSEPGFPWVPFTDDTPVRWTAGVDLATGEPCHVPAARVYMPYRYYVGSGDAPFDQPISTGLACHSGMPAAIRSAIAEAVERDCFLIVWQAMVSPPQIRLETLSAANRDLVGRFEAAAGVVTMFDITLDTGIPTILSALRGTHPGTPGLVVAASTSLDPEEAARKSLEELALTRLYSQDVTSRAPRLVPDPPEYANVVDQRTHLNFWCDHRAVPLASFLFASSVRMDFEDIAPLATGDPVEDVRVMVRRVHDVGERVIVSDLTTDDVGELGFAVVRAVIPGFHPLHVGYARRALGGTRLWQVPQRLGYPGITPQQGDNPTPHPYP
jgi:ribosomal protein S12 methylthiotransferase accessory factor